MIVRLGAGAIASALILAPLTCAATPLDDLIEPKAGHSACFARVHSSEHLRKNPKQRTTSMMVWFEYEPPLAGRDVVLGSALAMKFRGDPAALFSQGGCNWDERANRNTLNNRLIKTYPKEAGAVCLHSARPDVFESVSAQEGGSLIFDRGKDRDTLMVYLDDRLIMVKRANRGKQLDIRFGADDRVFLLRRTDIEDCAAIENAVTELEPGVAPRRR